MADITNELLKTQLRQLRLPTMGREFEKLARDAASGNQTFAQFLLRLTELELAARATNAVATTAPCVAPISAINVPPGASQSIASATMVRR